MLKRITIVVICFLLSSLSWAKKNLHPDDYIHKDWMNTAISQEENFFLYSNDQWIKNNPIPNDFAQWSIFRKLGKANLLRLRHLLEKLPSQEDAYAKKINQQLYALYQSGLDIRTIEKTKDTPLLGLIQQIKTIHNDQDLAQTIGLLHQIDVPVFFKFTSFFDYDYGNCFTFNGGENILNKEITDIETPVILNNIKILPYSYHRCWDDGEIKYVYHAGGNTGTKLERIKRTLKKDE